MKYYFRIIVLALLGINIIHYAQAIPPPDFIFNVGRQVVQMFTFLVLGLSLSLTFIRQFFREHPFYSRHKTALWIGLAILVIVIAYFGADWYGAYQQKLSYQQWLQQSAKNPKPITASSVPVSIPPLPTPTSTPPTQNFSYFISNSTTPESISNQDFANIPSNAYILDAREDEEYQNGRYPGSHHIRFADVVAREWVNLPTNQPVYVLCWSGIRGKEVADFLRTKNVLSRYL
ncbi:MAG TPA: rhodanese-like domain-containing protein, partial [Candidatus Limnocylindria bacterium]|nr:rhodanese-like domain-containing protein [Candidatus Limnocylindria bacterium]